MHKNILITIILVLALLCSCVPQAPENPFAEDESINAGGISSTDTSVAGSQSEDNVSDECSLPVPAESSEPVQNDDECSKSNYQIAVLPSRPNGDVSEEESEISEEESAQEPEVSQHEPVDRPATSVKLADALKGLGKKSVPYKSLVCYSAERDEQGANTILVIENNKESTQSTKTTYKFYEKSEDYENAKRLTSAFACFDELHILAESSEPDDVIENPDESLYIFIFGFVRY